MNKIFKNSKKIKLDDVYTLVPDSGNGVSLVFEETRTRKKKDDSEKEEYQYVNQLYFTRVNQALNRYVELSQNRSQNIKELIEQTSKIYAVIENFNITFKQF